MVKNLTNIRISNTLKLKHQNTKMQLQQNTLVLYVNKCVEAL